MLGGLSFILGLFSVGVSTGSAASKNMYEKMSIIKEKEAIEELGDRYNPELEMDIFFELKKEHLSRFLTKYPPLRMAYLCHLEMNRQGYESLRWVIDSRDNMLDPYKDHLNFYHQDFASYAIGDEFGRESEFHIFGLSGKIIPQFTTVMNGMNYRLRGPGRKPIIYHFYGGSIVTSDEIDPKFTVKRKRLYDTGNYIMVNMYSDFFGNKFPADCFGMKKVDAIKQIFLLSRKANALTYSNMHFHSFDEYDKDHISGTIVFNDCPMPLAYQIYADQKYNPNITDFVFF